MKLIFLILLLPSLAFGAVTVTVNGSNHTIPQTNERGWGNAVTAWIQAITSYTLQPTGGTFTLTNDVNFGANYGLKSAYFSTRSANPSSAGLLRLAVGDSIGWRNNANGANLLLAVDGSNNLTFNSVVLPTVSSTSTLTNKTIDADDNTISDIANANIKAAAGIEHSKMAALTASRVLVSDGSGVVSPSSITSTTLGYLDATSSIQTQLDAKASSASLSAHESDTSTHGVSTVAGLTEVQTLTNKTLTSPVINSPTGLVKADVGLGNVDNTSDATKNSAVAVLTNKDIDGGTASNSNRITLPKNSKTNLDGLTRKEGTLVYDTTGQKVWFDNGSTLQQVGSGAGSTSNLLTNGGFEETPYDTGWTVSNGTAASESTNIIEGSKSMAITLSAVNGTVVSQSITPSIQTSGVNFEHGMWVKTSLTTLQVCALQAGSEVSGSCTDVPSTNNWVLVNPNIAGPTSGTIGVRLKTTSSTTGTVYVDDAYVGIARNFSSVGVATDWTSFTPTGNWTTNTTYTGKWRRIGDTMHIQAKAYLSGAPNVATFTVNLPSGYSLDTSKIVYTGGGDVSASLGQVFINDNGTAAYVGTVIYDSANNRIAVYTQTAGFVNATQPMTWASGDSISLEFMVPIQGWTATQSAVTLNQSAAYTDWTSYTPTGAWVANTTYTGKWRRVGDTMEIDIGVTTTGTPTSASLTVNIPSGYTIDTSKLALGTGISSLASSRGLALDSSASTGYSVGAQYSSTTAILLVYQSNTSGANSVVNQAAPFAWASGDTLNITISVPITGWTTPSMPVPLIVGSVSSNSSGMERIERATVSATCSASPCTIASQSGSWVSSITRASAGTYTVNIAAGIFSGTPACHVMSDNYLQYFSSMPSSTSFSFRTTDLAAAFQDSKFNIMCMGPR